MRRLHGRCGGKCSLTARPALCSRQLGHFLPFQKQSRCMALASSQPLGFSPCSAFWQHLTRKCASNCQPHGGWRGWWLCRYMCVCECVRETMPVGLKWVAFGSVSSCWEAVAQVVESQLQWYQGCFCEPLINRLHVRNVPEQHASDADASGTLAVRLSLNVHCLRFLSNNRLPTGSPGCPLITRLLF